MNCRETTNSLIFEGFISVHDFYGKVVGGGYFLWHQGQGTVIDPGYDFIKNFHKMGGKMCDIHNIVLTHAHNDHNADFESILALLYKGNTASTEATSGKDGAAKMAVNLYLNNGCFMKFSGLLDLRGAEYFNDVQTLIPGHGYDLGNGLIMTALPAYHDEVVARKYAVGLCFTLLTHGGAKRLVPDNI